MEVTNNSNEILMALYVDAKDTEAVLSIVIGNPLNETSDYFFR
jgi:hypothetical protein